MSFRVVSLGSGRCSNFGGPEDEGMLPMEGLALVEKSDLIENWFARNFYPPRPHVGLGHTMNPKALYCAMAFGYGDGDGAGSPGPILPGVTREEIRRALFAVSANGKTVIVQALDWGPNRRTGRLIDLSPGAMDDLGIKTDAVVSVEAILFNALTITIPALTDVPKAPVFQGMDIGVGPDKHVEYDAAITDKGIVISEVRL